MRSATDVTGRLIEIPDPTTTQEAGVPKEETPIMNAHHPEGLEAEEETTVEAVVEKNMRIVTGGDSNTGLICATFDTRSHPIHCTDTCYFSSAGIYVFHGISPAWFPIVLLQRSSPVDRTLHHQPRISRGGRLEPPEIMIHTFDIVLEAELEVIKNYISCSCTGSLPMPPLTKTSVEQTQLYVRFSWLWNTALTGTLKWQKSRIEFQEPRRPEFYCSLIIVVRLQ